MDKQIVKGLEEIHEKLKEIQLSMTTKQDLEASESRVLSAIAELFNENGIFMDKHFVSKEELSQVTTRIATIEKNISV